MRPFHVSKDAIKNQWNTFYSYFQIILSRLRFFPVVLHSVRFKEALTTGSVNDEKATPILF